MAGWNLTPNATTYTILINRFAAIGNMELTLQMLAEMYANDIRPELPAAQDIIKLTADRGHPRLALGIASLFEANSVRRLDDTVWTTCLISCAEALFVSAFLLVSTYFPHISA